MAALAIASMGASLGVLAQAAPLRSAGGGNNRRPTPPKRNTALQIEIADNNEAVERRKAEKKARKLGR